VSNFICLRIKKSFFGRNWLPLVVYMDNQKEVVYRLGRYRLDSKCPSIEEKGLELCRKVRDTGPGMIPFQ